MCHYATGKVLRGEWTAEQGLEFFERELKAVSRQEQDANDFLDMVANGTPPTAFPAEVGALGVSKGLASADDVLKATRELSVARSALNGFRLRAQLAAKEIAQGHAFEKHVIEQGEFAGVRTRAEFAGVIEDVILNGEMRPLARGRSAYWRKGVVVIRDPSAVDGGTALVPKQGYNYFLGLS